MNDQISGLLEQAYQLLHAEQYQKALELTDRAQLLAKELNDPTGSAGSLIIAGRIRTSIGPIDQAIEDLKSGLALLDENDHPQFRARAYYGLAWAYSFFGDMLSANSYPQRAINIAQENHLPMELCDAYSIQAAILSVMGKYQPALELYEKSLEILKGTNDLNRHSICLNNIAMSKMNLGHYEEAEADAQHCLSLLPEDQFPDTKTSALDTLGMVYSVQGKYPKAIAYFQQAIHLLQINNDLLTIPELYLNLGKVLLQTNDLAGAEENLKTALAISEKDSATRYLTNCHEELANLYEKREVYRLALYHHKQSHHSIKSVTSYEKINEYAQAQIKLKVEATQKDAEIIRLKNQLLLQQLDDHLQRVSVLEYQAITDPLTGLFNRRHLEKTVPEFIRYARQKSVDLAIFLVDIDHFKQINDTYGHLSGDRVITQFGQLLSSTFRQSDLCCRYGGEEFFIALPDTNLNSSTEIAERLRKLVEGRSFEVNNDGTIINITISLGAACLSPTDETLAAFLHRADDALYKAKNTGRNKLVVAE